MPHIYIVHGSGGLIPSPSPIMSASTTPPAVGSGSSPSKKETVRAPEYPSQSSSDWIGTSLLTAKVIAAGTEFIPLPYVKGVFGVVVTLLETVEVGI